ncbi:NlpC/P60 family protein [Streptomyces sp. DSM 44915]|uniref:NlpC/P60 family protein n=1 Tax=Streptomyces chisholmiae TaxID=3075540 RepID=A0ABU2JJT7_9ACTN|nr:NlpC/P60 family protein [Streptomyces sp. DSM 44915]MDT0265245.1 NlpC/P60 family protein [Streptomyces sp. DSM 44915]
MGTHRKPRGGFLESPSARRGAIGVGAAALASATLLTNPAFADDDEPPAIEEQRDRADSAADRAREVRERVDQLYHEAGVATQHYNAAKEDVDAQQSQVDDALAAADAANERVNEARTTLGSMAAAQYRAGTGGLPDAAALLLADDPKSFFDTGYTLNRLTTLQQHALDTFTSHQQAADEERDAATEALTELEERENELQEQKQAVQDRLAEARALLDQLSEEEQAELAELERLEEEEAERQAEEARQERERREREEAERAAQEAAEAEEREQAEQEQQPEAPPATGDQTSQADAAIAFAESQLGKPYVWGATGPNSYDCSGLTQAAWLAAGVEIPRVTWDQVNIGTSVTRSQLQPGDLVFFYDDISHVGLYVGNNQMIHAPKPGDIIKYESIDNMPWHSAVRPG